MRLVKCSLFHWAKSKEQFKINPSFDELGILITLMFVNVFVFNVNMLVKSCNVFTFVNNRD
jgi:hypothetical protein